MLKKGVRLLEKNRQATIVLAIIWTIIILIGVSLPGNDLPKVDLFDNFDKVVHFTFFFVFFLLWKIPFSEVNKTSRIIIVISIILGFAIEFYQLNFVAGRSFDVWDGIFDSLGAIGGFIFYRYYLKVD